MSLVNERRQLAKTRGIVDAAMPDRRQAVTLIGGGEVDAAILSRLLRLAPRLCCADGGGDAIAAELLSRVEALYGDGDSLSGARHAALAEKYQRIAEQETSDFEKALARIDAPFILAHGFTGGRIDHSFAALQSLGRYRGMLFLVGQEDFCLRLKADVTLDLAAGTRLSLLALERAEVAMEGVAWPFEGALTPLAQMSLSNRALGGAHGPVQLRTDGGAVILTLPIEMLEAQLPQLLRRGSKA